MNVRAVEPEETAQVIEVLTNAFQDDPVLSWVWPTLQRRLLGMRRLFRAQLRHEYREPHSVQVGVASDGTIVSAALWSDPSPEAQAGIGRSLAQTTSTLRAAGRSIWRAKKLSDTFAAHHPKSPHWYLNKLATVSTVQREGWATAVMMDQLRLCDAQHDQVYLECTRESTIPFYERFGFRIVSPILVPDGGPTVWGMIRPPR